MAAAPKWKVYDERGHYQASCHEIEAAAALMGFYGNGATIRLGHDKRHVVWTEGAEDRSAMDSYDYVAIVTERREQELSLRLAHDAVAGKWRGE